MHLENKTTEFKREYTDELKYAVVPHDIVLGSKSGCFFRGAKYTSIESLLNASTADDIVFG